MPVEFRFLAWLNLYIIVEIDSIEHTFSNWQFSKAFQRRVIQWLNNINYTNQHQSVKETLFDLLPTSSIVNKTLLRKLNYTMLYMRDYIYNSRLRNRSITLSDFVNITKYNVEDTD